MYAHPSKKLLIMGSEFGQYHELNFECQLDWNLLDYPLHRKVQHFVSDPNHLYQAEPALHEVDLGWQGFQWIDLHDVDQSVLSILRRAKAEAPAVAEFVVVAANFTPVPHEGYRVGVTAPGFYKELLNSGSEAYGGSNMGNSGGLPADAIPWQGQPHSILIALPPLARRTLSGKTGQPTSDRDDCLG